ncbi:MAG: MFS transporter [Actinomycetota bacterium]
MPTTPEPSARSQLTLLAVGLVFAMTTWFAAAAVIGELRAEFDLSTTGGAWLTIAVQLGFVIGALVSAVANLADRVPPRRLVLIGATVAAVANLSLLVADGLFEAALGRALTGAGLALVYPAALKAASTWFVQGRGVALGVMVGALTVGSAVPHLVSGVGGVDWRGTVVATSVLTVAGGLLTDRRGVDGPYSFSRGAFDPRRALRVATDRELRLATLGYFGHMWELYAMWAWFGLFYADVLERGGVADADRWASLATFAVIAVGALGSVAAGRMSDRRDRETAAGVALVTSAVMAASIGFAVDAPPLLVLALGLVWGFAVVADSAQFSTIVSEVARPDDVGTALTTQLASGFVLTVFTIFLVPEVQARLGWGVAFLALAPGPIMGAVAMHALRRGRTPATAPV